jgi:hypothetical protein
MSVLLDTTMIHRGQIIVDDVHDVADVNATSGHTSGNKNRGIAGSESAHGVLSLDLSAVTVNRDHWELDIIEKVVQVVGFRTAIDEDDGANAGHLLKKSQKNVTLLTTLSLKHDLLNVRSSTSDATDSETDVRGRKMLLGEISSFLWERRREKAKLYVSYILLYTTQSAPMSY